MLESHHRACQCGAIYSRTEAMAPGRQIASYECAVCGSTLETWNTAWVPTYRLIIGPSRTPWRELANLRLFFWLRPSVKFTIEIYAKAGDGSEGLLHRTAVSTITPLGARKDARHLLADWKRRGAKSARVLNVRAETIYEVGE